MSSISTIIVLVPLVINILLMLLATSYIGCCFKAKVMSDTARAKKAYVRPSSRLCWFSSVPQATRIFGVALAGWLFFLLVLIVLTQANNPRVIDQVLPFLSFLVSHLL